MELRKIEDKDKIMENSYVVFQIREAVGLSQIVLQKRFKSEKQSVFRK